LDFLRGNTVYGTTWKIRSNSRQGPGAGLARRANRFKPENVTIVRNYGVESTMELEAAFIKIKLRIFRLPMDDDSAAEFCKLA
jgi:hypothetical protein